MLTNQRKQKPKCVQLKNRQWRFFFSILHNKKVKQKKITLDHLSQQVSLRQSSFSGKPRDKRGREYVYLDHALYNAQADYINEKVAKPWRAAMAQGFQINERQFTMPRCQVSMTSLKCHDATMSQCQNATMQQRQFFPN